MNTGFTTNQHCVAISTNSVSVTGFKKFLLFHAVRFRTGGLYTYFGRMRSKFFILIKLLRIIRLRCSLAKRKITVLSTELEFTEGCKIEVIWKHDSEWQGKCETVFDFATVEVRLQH